MNYLSSNNGSRPFARRRGGIDASRSLCNDTRRGLRFQRRLRLSSAIAVAGICCLGHQAFVSSPGSASSRNEAVDFGSTAVAKSTNGNAPRQALHANANPSATLDTSVDSFKVDGNAASNTDESLEVSEWLPRAVLFFMAVCCSTNFTLLKVMSANHSEATVAAVRFCIALVPFLPLIPKHMNRSSIQSGVEIGLWCTLGYISQAIGLQTTEASTGAFLCSLAMIVVPVVKCFCGAKVQTQTWIAVLLAVTGTSFLVGLIGGGGGAASGPGMGEALCSLTAVGFGLMFVRMDDYAKEKDFDPLGCTIWQVVTLAFTMTAWLFISSGPATGINEAMALLSSGPEILMPLLWVGIVTTAGVLYIETWCMEKMDGAEAGVIFASEPVWATMFASQVLGERFGMTEGIGSAFILSACVLTQVGGKEEEPQEKLAV